jgi:hypothetical protein
VVGLQCYDAVGQAKGDAMGLLIDIPGITTGASMVYALSMVRNHFTGFKLRQPPLPANAFTLMPCRILITDTDDPPLSVRTGRIQFLSQGVAVFDQRWSLDSA